MPDHSKPRGRPCAHATYRMSCPEYDQLVNRAAGRCQICGVEGAETKHGFLVIDHDAEVGQWAVRGLLCSNCNTALPMGSTPDRARAYLADPWWRRQLDEVGHSGEPMPEPPLGSTVLVQPNNRQWQRTERGWRHTARYGGIPRSWARLNRGFGPHRITILDAATD